MKAVVITIILMAIAYYLFRVYQINLIKKKPVLIKLSVSNMLLILAAHKELETLIQSGDLIMGKDTLKKLEITLKLFEHQAINQLLEHGSELENLHLIQQT